MALVTKKKPLFSYPYRGMADKSWPGCPNCQGYGVITLELAMAGARGLKGDPCATCNGVGRVPDPTWPPCPECLGRPDNERCPVCVGLGLLSPEKQAALAAGQIVVPCEECRGAGAVPYPPPRAGLQTPDPPGT